MDYFLRCGLANRKASLNKIGSETDADVSEYPWHVRQYKTNHKLNYQNYRNHGVATKSTIDTFLQ